MCGCRGGYWWWWTTWTTGPCEDCNFINSRLPALSDVDNVDYKSGDENLSGQKHKMPSLVFVIFQRRKFAQKEKMTSLLCCFSQIREGATQAHISKSITSCSTQRLSLTTTLLLQKLFIHWRFQTLPLKWYIGMGQIIESKSSEKQKKTSFAGRESSEYNLFEMIFHGQMDENDEHDNPR